MVEYIFYFIKQTFNPKHGMMHDEVILDKWERKSETSSYDRSIREIDCAKS